MTRLTRTMRLTKFAGLSVVTAAVMAAMAQPAAAQSFDCRNSSVKAERAVCGSDRLSDLDVTMSDLYDRLIVATPGARGREQVRRYQRQFLAARNACGGDKGCIKGAYQDQISVLSARVRTARYE